MPVVSTNGPDIHLPPHYSYICTLCRMAVRRKRTRVGMACERCRRQKLRCDIQRPCTLCVHAGTECQTGPSDQFRVFQTPSQSRKPKRSSRRSPLDRRTEANTSTNAADQPWSSSTMALVAGAFELHNSATPDASVTTAMPGGQGLQNPELPPAGNDTGRVARPENTLSAHPFVEGLKTVTTELLSLLPSREVAALLIDTYFDRAHWFILIFHQEPSRKKWLEIYDTPFEILVTKSPNPGAVSTLLMVIAIALQYTGRHRQQILQAHGVDHMAMKKHILSVIRSKLLDIVSMNSIEAVQTCVLLGTYYLYHGTPTLAWPVCGCGLRIAQALKLHRQMPITDPIPPEAQQRIETRKRCWWAIYEIETFCSISYGYPHGIVDADCNVELLDPLATSSGRSSVGYNDIHMCPTTLLSYKYWMSKLSVLLKDVLTTLYGIGSNKTSGPKSRGSSFDFRTLIHKVPILEDRLEQWKAEISGSLLLTPSIDMTYSSAEEMDRDIGASGPGFERHIYQLQALILALAYENARILIHRPLITYRNRLDHGQEPGGSSNAPRSTPSLSLQACRSAAMNTSQIGESPIFSLAAETYASAFISIHIFTAGVMLCVLASIQSLTPESQESKIGLRRLLSMQAELQSRSKSAVSSQSLGILERLVRLVMEKELNEMLGSTSKISSQEEQTEAQSGEQWQGSSQNQLDSQLAQDVDTTYGTTMSEMVEDTNISKALFDLDQVLSENDLDIPFDPFLLDTDGPNNAFTGEQAWIWSMENPTQFNVE